MDKCYFLVAVFVYSYIRAALKYRFGWKKSEKIHYYSEFLGMKDTITEEDMLIDITKTEIEKRLTKSEIEKRLTKSERENEILKERLKINESKWLEVQTQVAELRENLKPREKEPLIKEPLINTNTKTNIFYQDKSPITLNKIKESFRVVEVEV